MAKTMPGIVAHHRSVLERYGQSPEKAPLESTQIVLLADILDALTGAKPAMATKAKP